ncbi:MAG: class I SAM-dependent methyltransferase [Cyanobacteria bacterium HKST-UBA02]|nr:class I SAM-dependent methyltransferase [Cyanobacteria bacterium HKST-UBA02]
MSNKSELVEKHYDGCASDYHLQYERDSLSDTSRPYPANYFRLHLLLNSFVESQVQKIVEVGVGEGTPLLTLSKAGMSVAGFDISKEMVQRCKETLDSGGIDSTNIIWGDIQDPITYAPLIKNGPYDALLAMGVMPHVHNDGFVLQNMKALVKPGGRVFVEFRNKLFSLFTFNRYTYEFIVDDLLGTVHPKLKDAVKRDLEPRLEMSKPSPRLVEEGKSDIPGYDAILSKFHNPFEVLELFADTGFVDCRLLWYHYHPAMPYLSEHDEELFREQALKLEHEASGWKGYFLCSAFVVEATKPTDQ